MDEDKTTTVYEVTYWPNPLERRATMVHRVTASTYNYDNESSMFEFLSEDNEVALAVNASAVLSIEDTSLTGSKPSADAE